MIPIRLVILTAALIFALACLTGCRSNGNSAQGQELSAEGNPQAQENLTEAYTLPKESLTIDLAEILNDGYMPTAVQPTYGGNIAIFATAGSPEGRLDNESCRIYSLSAATGKLSKNFVETGSLEPFAYNNPVFWDGSVFALENGETQNILFVNLKNMKESRIPLPEGLEIRSLSISPDKTQIAYTVHDGTYLCDMAFSDPRRVLARYNGDDASGNEDRLDKVGGWSIDGKYLLYHKVGYEWTLGHGALCPETSGDSFFAIPDTGAKIFRDGMLLYHEYENIPVGLIDLKNPAMGIRPFDESFEKSPLDYLNISPDGKYLGQIRTQGEETFYRIVHAQSGEVVSQLADTKYSNSLLTFLPDSEAAVLMTNFNLENKTGELLIWIFGAGAESAQ